MKSQTELLFRKSLKTLALSLAFLAAATAVIPCFASAATPVPQWLLRFSGDFQDVSGNGKVATTTLGTSAAVISYDAVRGQIYAKTSGNYVRVTHLLDGSYTKSAWINVPNTTGGNIISAGQAEGGDLFQVSTATNGGLVNSTFSLKAGQSIPAFRYQVQNPTLFATGTWTHVAVTYNASNKEYRLYQGGQLVGSSTSTQIAHASSSIQDIGVYRGVGTWAIRIDDAAVWDTALSDSQILDVYQGDLGVANEAPSAPGNLSGYAANQSAVFSWSIPMSDGGSILTDYLVEYKPTSGSVWTTFNDGVATTTGTTVTGLTNGQSYDFRVKAVNAVGTSTSSNIVTLTPNVRTYMHILSTGQSLSLGVSSPVSSSLVQPYNNVSLSPGPVGTSSPLIPLKEFVDESPSSGMANTLSSYSVTGNPFAVGLHGRGGTGYTGIKKGSANYAKGMEQASTTKTLVEAEGNVYRPIAVTVVHGEEDWALGNFSQYEGYLKEWQRDYETDLNALTGSSSTIPLFTNQMNGKMSGEIAVAQFLAHKNNPGKVILAGPKYQYVYSGDGLHLLSPSSKHMGEMLGKVIQKVVVEGKTWNPLMPTAVVRNGNVITIDYNIPVGNLAIDTTIVAQRPNYGFEFLQSSSTATTSISSVELVNGNTQVQITLDSVPDGSNQRVRYAWNCPAQQSYGCGKATDSTYVGGNIRDTDSAPSPAIGSTGLPLYDWSVTFDEPVSLYVPPAPAPSASPSHAPGSVTAVSSAPMSSAEIARTFGLPAPAANAAPDFGCAGGNAFSTMTGKACAASGTAGTPALPSGAFSANLSLGMTGPDVIRLQKYLNAKGFAVAASGAGSPGKETSYFGPATRAALARFQKASGIAPAAGYFGPATRALVNR